MNNKYNNLILDDAICFKLDSSTGKAVSNVKDSFIYNYFVKNQEANKDDESYKSPIDRLICYNDIYVYMLNEGYLLNKDYCMYWSSADEEYHYFFTLNLSKLMDDVDLEDELLSHFTSPKYREYIKLLCYPTKECRCVCCGAVCFSRLWGLGNDTPYAKAGSHICMGCATIDDDVRYDIRDVYEAYGDYIANAFKLQLFSTCCDELPSDVSIEDLLKGFEDEFKSSKVSDKVKLIRELLSRKGMDSWEAFDTDDFGIVVWNKKELSNPDVFLGTFDLNREKNRIEYIYSKEFASYIGEAAICYAESLTQDEEELALLHK